MRGVSLKQRFIRPRAVLSWTVFLFAVVSGTSRGQDCDANATLSVGHASAPSGQVVVELRGSSMCDVTGLSAAVGHDPRRVEFLRAKPGEFLQSQANGALFFSASARNADGYMSLFVAFDWTSPPRPIPEDSSIAVLYYRILPGTRPGTMPLRNVTREFGNPPIANIFTTLRSAIDPQLQDGSITISDCNTSASLFVGHAAAPAGEVAVELRGGSFCKVTGFTMGVGHDVARLQFIGAEPGPFLETEVGDNLFFLAEEHNDEGFMSLEVAFDQPESMTVTSLTIPEDSLLATFHYTIRRGTRPGTFTLLNESEAFGDPPIANVFTTEDDSVLEPELEDGSITVMEVVEPMSEFVRGDADGDGNFDVSDVVIAITYRAPGGVEPPCFKAVDSNDDGRVDLADALYLLDFVFGVGPAPHAPFPDCGMDETEDDLTCKSFPACS